MDCRLTLKTGDTFVSMLTSALEEGEKVYLLLDEDGLDRTEGFVKTIVTNSSSTVVELQSGQKVELKSIVAVNGIFLPEYGEC